jgi:hypothetical protein
MKYYLLLALSLPILSSESSKFFAHILEDDKLDQIIQALPNITEINFRQEKTAADNLGFFTKTAKEQLLIVYQANNASTKLIKLIDRENNPREFMEADLALAKNSALAIKLCAYLKNVQTIHAAMQKKLAKFEEVQRLKKEIKSLEKFKSLLNKISEDFDKKPTDKSLNISNQK